MLAAAVTGLPTASLGWFLGMWMFTAIAGRPPVSTVAGAVAFIGTYTILFPLFSWLLTGGRPAVLRFGSDAIELGAQRHDAVRVPYEIVSSAQVRRWWPITVFEVFVDAADSSQVSRVDREGRRPLRKRKGSQVRFSMPIVGLTASTSDVRSQLRRRGVSG
ncbi:hypothetical protein OHA21_15010 [Actinoplanes sp. NBC_00393]|uniref:hypothetical protein n=1 Tax=Actinoplanes sp. NBC_00393 TaxID=2975953 RepID=UPI002E20AE46